MTEPYKPPTTRVEALHEIMTTGATISAMLAVAAAFPLPGEEKVTDEFLAKLREVDSAFYEMLLVERDDYLRSWGRL